MYINSIRKSYWRKLNQRSKEDGNETVTNCHRLKLKVQNDKYWLADVCDIEEIFKRIKSFSSRNTKFWQNN